MQRTGVKRDLRRGDLSHIAALSVMEVEDGVAEGLGAVEITNSPEIDMEEALISLITTPKGEGRNFALLTQVSRGVLAVRLARGDIDNRNAVLLFEQLHSIGRKESATDRLA